MLPNPKADITQQSGWENLRTELIVYAPFRLVFRFTTLQQQVVLTVSEPVPITPCCLFAV